MSSFSVAMIAATLFGVHESELPTENEIRATIQRSIPYCPICISLSSERLPDSGGELWLVVSTGAPRSSR
jgi:hypothetical protein